MRATKLKQVSIGVVIIVFLALILLGTLRARADNKDNGGDLFVLKGCAQCHYTDSQQTKGGPGLKGLFAREALPVSNREINEENVKKQLKDPYKNMPSFADRLTKEEKDLLVEYLKTL